MRRFLIAVTAALLLGAFALPASGGDAEYVINFGTVAPEGTPWADQLKGIQTNLQTASKGRIKVRLFLSGVMGGEVEQVRDIMENGRLQGGGFSSAAVATGANVPALQIPELPYLFRDLKEADHVLDTVLFEPIKKQLKRRGLYLSMWAENGWRSFYTKNKPVKTMADLAEHKMRVQESKVHKKMYAAFGVQAVPIPTPEVLDALNRGTVDGFDNTSLFGQASGWFEPTKYYTLSRHIYQPAAIIFGQEFVDGLPDDLRPLIENLINTEQAPGRKGVRDLEAALIENYREMGLTIYEPTAAELAPFQAAAQGVHVELRDELGASLMDDVSAALKTYRGE